MTEADVYAEIGEVCNGSEPGREGDEIIDHLAHAREKRALEHKVFGRIAGQKQFAGNDNISPRSGGFSARLLQKFGIA